MTDTDTPDFLLIGERAMYWLRIYGWLDAPTRHATQSEPDPLPEAERPAERKHIKGNGRRTYKSVYVGVTTHNNRFVAPGSGGKVHPKTPEGERWAAQDRARDLERDYLERRDGTNEPYPQYDPEEMADG